MKVEMEGEDIINGIVKSLNKMVSLTDQEEKKAMQKIGKVIAKHVKEALPRSDRNHKHMQDDVKTKVSTKQGFASCTIGGGKETGYKWHMVDDGTRDKNGNIHTPAHHFTDKALKMSEKEIDSILNEAERQLVKE